MPKVSVVVWPDGGAHSVLRYIPYFYKGSHAALIVWDASDNIAAYLSFYPGVVRRKNPNQEKRCCANADKYASHFHHYEDDDILKVDGNWVFPEGVRVFHLSHHEINVENILSALEILKIDKKQQWGIQSNCSDLVLYALRQGIPPSDYSKRLYNIADSFWLKLLLFVYANSNSIRLPFDFRVFELACFEYIYGEFSENISKKDLFFEVTKLIQYSSIAMKKIKLGKNNISLWKKEWPDLLQNIELKSLTSELRELRNGHPIITFCYMLGKHDYYYEKWNISLVMAVLLRSVFTILQFRKMGYPQSMIMNKIRVDCMELVAMTLIAKLVASRISIVSGLLVSLALPLHIVRTSVFIFQQLPIIREMFLFHFFRSFHNVKSHIMYSYSLRDYFRVSIRLMIYDRLLRLALSLPIPGLNLLLRVFGLFNVLSQVFSVSVGVLWPIRAVSDLTIPNGVMKVATQMQQAENIGERGAEQVGLRYYLSIAKPTVKNVIVAAGLFSVVYFSQKVTDVAMSQSDRVELGLKKLLT